MHRIKAVMRGDNLWALVPVYVATLFVVLYFATKLGMHL